MPIFSIEGSKLRDIREVAFSKEAKLQELTEANLETVLGLKFLSSGFKCRSLIIDTLAFNPESKSFVVIEYKKEKNFTVIDQGYAYLQLVVNNKADFVLEYNKQMNAKLDKKDVDWSQSRVLFVCPGFTEYQRQSINFRDLPMELWEVHKYDNGSISYDQILPTQAEESIVTVAGKRGLVKDVIKEIRVTTEEDHIQRGSDQTRELYAHLKKHLLQFGGDVRVKPQKFYVAFKRSTNFADVEIQKSKLKVTINAPWGSLKDPTEIARNVKTKGHWGNGDYLVTVGTMGELPEVIGLISQSYNRN